MVAEVKVLDLGGALTAHRAKRGLSMREVGAAVGLSKATISNIERGIFRPRRTTFARLVEYLREQGYEVREVA